MCLSGMPMLSWSDQSNLLLIAAVEKDLAEEDRLHRKPFPFASPFAVQHLKRLEQWRSGVPQPFAIGGLLNPKDNVPERPSLQQACPGAVGLEPAASFFAEEPAHE
jgi:hypothetical protein